MPTLKSVSDRRFLEPQHYTDIDEVMKKITKYDTFLFDIALLILTNLTKICLKQILDIVV